MQMWRFLVEIYDGEHNWLSDRHQTEAAAKMAALGFIREITSPEPNLAGLRWVEDGPGTATTVDLGGGIHQRVWVLQADEAD